MAVFNGGGGVARLPSAGLMAALLLGACNDPAPSAGPAEPAPTARETASTQSGPPPEVVVVPAEESGLAIPPARYPALAATADAAEGFAPPGWGVEHQASGDLNGDGRADLVLVLRQRDPANLIVHDGLGVSPLDTNPRLLAFAFGTPGGPFRLVEQNHVFIPRRTSPVFQDPLEEPPAIRNGVVSIRLAFFASAGSWSMSSSTARFRYGDGRFQLIGHDHTEVRRNTGEMVERSVNYLTRRVSTVNTTIDAEDPAEPVWTTLPPGPLLTLAQVGDGLAFNPVGTDP